ncbi:MAG: 50S ribosomal protein L20 [candidate division KSB1 bacterium]|nr:50S ribosomal protein L20 [candidate division KSB1 bacterium]
MPRSKYAVPSHRRRRKIIKRAKGYWGRRKNLIRTAKEAVDRALAYAYRDRRVKKREFRKLWITRINAAARMAGLTYSSFIAGLKRNNVDIDRKMLAELAVKDPEAFKKLAEIAKQ